MGEKATTYILLWLIRAKLTRDTREKKLKTDQQSEGKKLSRLKSNNVITLRPDNIKVVHQEQSIMFHKNHFVIMKILINFKISTLNFIVLV